LTQYQQHFQLFQTKLGSHLVGVPKMKIEFKDEHIHAESSCYPRAVSPEGDKIIRENLSELLQAACIRKSLNPRIISPCHLVKYPDKKDRFVISKCQSTFSAPYRFQPDGEQPEKTRFPLSTGIAARLHAASRQDKFIRHLWLSHQKDEDRD
jgi:hypothetical protein